MFLVTNENMGLCLYICHGFPYETPCKPIQHWKQAALLLVLILLNHVSIW